MTDQERPNLALGEPPGKLRDSTNSRLRRLFWMILITQMFVLLALAMIVWRMGPLHEMAAVSSSATSERLKAEAVELEERGLEARAAGAWAKYLDANPDTEQYADILYRIGKLLLRAEEFDSAAAALIRSQLAAQDDQELQGKIGPKLVQSLRRAGRYGEVGRELARQVRVGGEDAGRAAVLATMGQDEITDADLDQMLERRVDRMLAMQGSSDDPNARQSFLRQLSSPQMRRRLLQEILQTELSCRRARELKLDREEEFIQARDQMIQTLLANHFLTRQLKEIRPTAVDLEAYYTANQKQYEQPESIDVVSIKLGAEEDPGKILGQITSADDFRKLARQRSRASGLQGADPPGEEDQPPPTRRVVRGVADPLLGDTEPLFELGQDAWTKKPHVSVGDEKYLLLVLRKIEARAAPLAEVESQVRAEYTARKQRELTEQLFHDLMVRYQVRLVEPAQPDDSPGSQPVDPPGSHPAEETDQTQAAQERRP